MAYRQPQLEVSHCPASGRVGYHVYLYYSSSSTWRCELKRLLCVFDFNLAASTTNLAPRAPRFSKLLRLIFAFQFLNVSTCSGRRVRPSFLNLQNGCSSRRQAQEPPSPPHNLSTSQRPILVVVMKSKLPAVLEGTTLRFPRFPSPSESRYM